jgi:RNA polymerase sigma-70 factor (ECF subfamily)
MTVRKDKPTKPTPVLQAFQKHQAALRRFISRFVQRTQDIDDVAQEAFLRAYRAEKGKPIEQPKSFLFRIAHNVAITELTKKSTQIIDYIADIDESAVVWLEHSAEETAMADQMIGIHCEAVAQLPPQCRRVFLMRKVHGMSHKDIASELGIAISTVEKHMTKAVRDCANYVEKHAGDTPIAETATPDNRVGQQHG